MFECVSFPAAAIHFYKCIQQEGYKYDSNMVHSPLLHLSAVDCHVQKEVIVVALSSTLVNVVPNAMVMYKYQDLEML